jgi:hypothetical protein
MKEYLDLTQSISDETGKLNCVLTFDQVNYLNFLYHYRKYWQGYYMPPVNHLGLNF